MARNPYFSEAYRSEQNLYEDIVIESLKIYGNDIYYLPRDLIEEDRILGEDIQSRFNSSYKIEMYIENIEGFDGEGDLFTRFGVEIRDQATFIVSRRRWDQSVRKYDNEITGVRPLEGDLLYIPFSKKIFQIMHVEHEQPFYQLMNLPTYKLRVELFEYSEEQFDTGIENVDSIENDAYTLDLVLVDSDKPLLTVGTEVTQSLTGGVTIRGEVSEYVDSSNTLSLVHVGADDGKYHMFTTGTINYTDSDGVAATRQVASIGDEVLNQANNQNDYFDSLTDFLDFSESNPFGDPS